jgi:L-fuculose-phosphate aldolase
MTEDAEAVARTYRALGAAGLSFGTSGNVSCRTGSGMLITRSGVSVDAVAAADVVPVALDGAVPGGMKPSSEWFMHADIYAAFPDARAVVHAHADASTALSCLGRPIPAFHYMVAGFGGDDVRCTDYATFGTPELGRLAVKALEGRTACLLGNHGMICHGASLDRALAGAIRLEALARQYLLACSAGEPRLLDAEAMRRTRERYRSYG